MTKPQAKQLTLSHQTQTNYSYLEPIYITYHSVRYMLNYSQQLVSLA